VLKGARLKKKKEDAPQGDRRRGRDEACIQKGRGKGEFLHEKFVEKTDSASFLVSRGKKRRAKETS